MKKFFSVVIILSILFTSLLTVNVFASDEESDNITVNGIEYAPDDTYCSVSNCDKELNGDVVIPSFINFHGKKLPVKEINSWAFESCQKITGVTVPDSVTLIDSGAFSDCSQLKNVTLSKNIDYIPYYMCYKCGSLESITVPEKVTAIGGFAFSGCENLENVYLPESLTEIDEEAFSGCDNLVSIKIPKNVSVIGEIVFAECRSFTTFDVDESNACFSADDGVLFSKDKTKLVIYPYAKGTEYSVPEGVKEISAYAFYENTEIEKITLPEGLLKIGNFAFNGCVSLERIDLPASLTKLGLGALANCTNMKEINVNKNNASFVSPGGVLFNKDMTELIAYPVSNETEQYTIPDSVVKIGDYAFFNCYKLLSLTVPDGLAEIGEYVFNWCDQLSYTKYGNCLYIGSETNKYIILVSVEDDTRPSYEINENTKFICNDAFQNCTEFASITIPDSVVSIGEYAFYNCLGLTSATVGSGLKRLGAYSFSWCEKLSEFNIPDDISLTEIKDSAFCGCLSLTSFTVPDGTAKIGDFAFCWCDALESIVLPESLTEIGYSAFDGCYALKTVFYKCGKQKGEEIFIDTYNDQLLYAIAVYNYGNLLPGDCNSDGAVDNKDVVVLFRYVSGGEKAADETVYDYNGDGEVNNKDVVELFRYVSSK